MNQAIDAPPISDAAIATPPATGPGPVDRPERERTAGPGDLLGESGTGVGDPVTEETPPPTLVPNQHRFADLEPATDAAQNYHGRAAVERA